MGETALPARENQYFALLRPHGRTEAYCTADRYGPLFNAGRRSSSFLVERWIRREPAALQEVRQLLEKAGHDNETIMAQTLIALIEKVEAIDKLISRAESRYNAAIRDINDHRAALAQRRHDAITDADYEELDNEENAA